MSMESTDGYMDLMKAALLTEPEVYTQSLDLMTDFYQKRLKERATEVIWEEVSEEVASFVRLFRNHPQLIRGFNFFLPNGMKVSMEGDLVCISYNGETKLIEDKEEEEQVVEKKASFIVGGDESINDDWDVVDEGSEAGNKKIIEDLDELEPDETNDEIHEQQNMKEEAEEDDASEDGSASSEDDMEDEEDESDQSCMNEEEMELNECDELEEKEKGGNEAENDEELGSEDEALEEGETQSKSDDATENIERENEIRSLKRKLKRTEEDNSELRRLLIFAFIMLMPYLPTIGQNLFFANSPKIHFHAPETRDTLKCSLLGARPIEGRKDLMEFSFKIDIEQPWATISGHWGNHRAIFHQYSFLANGTGSSSETLDWDKPQVVTTRVSKVFNTWYPKENEYEMELFAGLRVITNAEIRGDTVFRYNVDCKEALLEEKKRWLQFVTSLMGCEESGCF